MNAARNMKIKFLVNGKLDHVIEKTPGKHVDSTRATKKKKIFHIKEEESNANN